MDVQVLGRTIPGRGVLVVKDAPRTPQQQLIPGLLGMNVIHECYEEQQGEALFSSLSVVQAEACWALTLLVTARKYVP